MSFADLMGKHRGAKRRRKNRKSSSGPINLESLSVEDRIRRLRTAYRKSPTASATSSTAALTTTHPPPPQEQQTLALLFMIIDTLPFENIWRRWIESNNNSKVNVQILIHAKYPARVQSSWVRTHLTKTSHVPEWGSVELTRAMITLAEECLSGCTTQSMRLLYCSESCLPVLSFQKTYEELWSSTTSWLDVSRKPRNGYNGSSQWVPIEKSSLVPAECVCKSDQWVCLTRRHAEHVLNLPSLVGHTDLWHALQGRRIISDVNGAYPDNTRENFRIGQVPLGADGKPSFVKELSNERIISSTVGFCHK